MAARIAQRMRAALARRESAGTLRTTTFADAPLIDFASNDYLGIARDAAVAEAHLVEELRRHATEPRVNGSTGSRLLSGACGAHEFTHGVDDIACMRTRLRWPARRPPFTGG